MPSLALMTPLIVIVAGLLVTAVVVPVVLWSVSSTSSADCFLSQQVDTGVNRNNEVGVVAPWAWSCHPSDGGTPAANDNLCQIFFLDQVSGYWQLYAQETTAPPGGAIGRIRGVDLKMDGTCAAFLETDGSYLIRVWCYNSGTELWEESWTGGIPFSDSIDVVEMDFRGDYIAVSAVDSGANYGPNFDTSSEGVFVKGGVVRTYRRSSPGNWVVDMDWTRWTQTANPDATVIAGSPKQLFPADTEDLSVSQNGRVAVTCELCRAVAVFYRVSAGNWNSGVVTPNSAAVEVLFGYSLAIYGDNMVVTSRNDVNPSKTLVQYHSCVNEVCTLQHITTLSTSASHAHLDYVHPYLVMHGGLGTFGYMRVFDSVNPANELFNTDGELGSPGSRAQLDPALNWVHAGVDGPGAIYYSLHEKQYDSCGVCDGDDCSCACGNGVVEAQCGEECEKTDACCNNQCKFRPSSYVCRASSGDDVCDPPETCTGSNSLCPADYKETVGFNCGDLIYCNGLHSCSAQYLCEYTPVDCSSLDAPCLEGVCNEQLSQCEALPRDSNTSCVADSLGCTKDHCSGVDGSCVVGPIPDCSYLDLSPCIVGECQEPSGQCFPADTGSNDSSCVGCDGVQGSVLRYDDCCVCGGDGSSCLVTVADFQGNANAQFTATSCSNCNTNTATSNTFSYPSGTQIIAQTQIRFVGRCSSCSTANLQLEVKGPGGNWVTVLRFRATTSFSNPGFLDFRISDSGVPFGNTDIAPTDGSLIYPNQISSLSALPTGTTSNMQLRISRLSGGNLPAALTVQASTRISYVYQTPDACSVYGGLNECLDCAGTPNGQLLFDSCCDCGGQDQQCNVTGTFCGDGRVTGGEQCDPAVQGQQDCCDPSTCHWKSGQVQCDLQSSPCIEKLCSASGECVPSGAARPCCQVSGCDNFTPCTGVETCNQLSGVCEIGAPLDCSLLDQPSNCTFGLCDVQSQQCVVQHLLNTCGDGILECGEECEADLNTGIFNSTCDPLTCLNITSVCGNEILEQGEQCDDATDECCDQLTCQFKAAGTSCTGVDVCNNYECSALGECDFASTVVCDDADPCNGEETCNPSIGCISGPAPQLPSSYTIYLELANNSVGTCGSDGSTPDVHRLLPTSTQVVQQPLVVQSYSCMALSEPSPGAAVFTNGDEVSFHADGSYQLRCTMTTNCGQVVSDSLTVVVSDCCGNGVLDALEQCESSLLSGADSNCCTTQCSFVADGVMCPDDQDPCTHTHHCNGLGQCVHEENQIFELVAQQPLTQVDSQCTVDSRLFTILALVSDPIDNTPGLYNWQLSVQQSSAPSRHVLVSSSGSSQGGVQISGPAPSIRMDGGGLFVVALSVTSPCGHTKQLNFTYERDCCGNSQLNSGEVCDTSTDPLTCASDCLSLLSVCGDGSITGNELCDTALQPCCEDCFSASFVSKVCRSSMGVCDPEEHCDGVNYACTQDLFHNSSVVCMPAMGVCDVEERCDGSGPHCQADLPAPSTTVAHFPQGACELVVYCDGVTKQVPPRNLLVAGTVCQTAQNQCYADGTCSGLGAACNPSSPLPIGSSCEADNIPCTTDQCDGVGQCLLQVDSCECIDDTDCVVVNPLCTVANCSQSTYTCSIYQIPGTCLVDGVCYSDGDPHPSNGCLYCDSSETSTQWSPRPEGSYCDTGTPTGLCSEQDQCNDVGVCEERYKNATTVCLPKLGDCDVEDFCPGNGDFCGVDTFEPSSKPCRTPLPEEDCVQVTYCSGSSAQCPQEVLFPDTHQCGGTVRGPCEVARLCSGVDRQCEAPIFLGPQHVCHSPPQANQCEKPSYCADPSVPQNVSGLYAWECEPISYHDASMPCGGSPQGPCEGQRFCTLGGPFCPSSEIRLSSQCGADPGLCADAPTCNPSAAAWWECPAPVPYPQGSSCRSSTGDCDPADYCDGVTYTCDDVRYGAETICHTPAGECEMELRCDLSSPHCPSPVYHNSSVVCREAQVGAPCDIEETCDGVSAFCPVDDVYPYGHVAVQSRGDCHIGAVCDGINKTPLPEQWQPNGHVCHTAEGPCEETLLCDGVTDSCPARNYLVGSVCLAAQDACQPAVLCVDQNPFCPQSIVYDNSTVCAPAQGACEVDGYCENGVCPGVGYRENDYLCAHAPSVCYEDSYCQGVGQGACPAVQQRAHHSNCSTDGIPCTTQECNQAGECVLLLDSCACMVDSDCANSTLGGCVHLSCQNYHCQAEIIAGTCRIDGACYAEGQLNPNFQCLSCQTAYSQVDWTPVDAGVSCYSDTPQGLCSAQDTCDGAGQCVDRYLGNSTVCRVATEPCDVEERCSGSADDCPVDSHLGSSHRCYTADPQLPCDVDRYCPQSGVLCPADAAAPSSTLCAAPRGDCEQAAYCRGTSPAQDPEAKLCPERLLVPQGAICGATPASCEKQSYCGQGAHFNASAPWLCPSLELQPDTHQCRGAASSCDKAEFCDPFLQVPGHSDPRTCPLDIKYPSGQVCATARGDCEEDAVCDGLNDACPQRQLRQATHICHVPQNGTCGIVTYCDPQAAVAWECPATQVLPQGTPCGESARGLCELQGVCDGVSEQCGQRTLLPSGTVCRASSSPLCDPAEQCDPNSVLHSPWECPADQLALDGSSCQSAPFCSGVQQCQAGVCVTGPAPSCDDQNECTLDVCDQNTQQCMHASNPLIGQVCYTGAVGTVNVGQCREGIYECDVQNGQLACVGEVLPLAQELCQPIGVDENCNSLVDEGCLGGQCSTHADCLPFLPLPCVQALCDAQTQACHFPPLPNSCVVNGQCALLGAADPSNPCRSCQPALSNTEYSANDQAIVDDSNICNGVEVCLAGDISLIAQPLTCQSHNGGCSEGLCDPQTGCYTAAVQDGTACTGPGVAGESCACLSEQCVCVHEDDDDFPVLELAIVLPIVLGVMFIIWALCWCSVKTAGGKNRSRRNSMDESQPLLAQYEPRGSIRRRF